MQKIKIHYIYHSSFIVEIGEYALLFDFYNNSKEGWNYVEKILDQAKKIIVFSSHSHRDHYSKDIFIWDGRYSNIDFVLSSDIQIGEKKNNFHKLFTNHDLKLDFVNIHAFGSTDLGVSYMVSICGKNIFHAGDLNWWDWGDEDTPTEKINMEKRFKRIIDEIRISKKKIDIAFFPIDPRLMERKERGVLYFLENVQVEYLIPMHFWDEYAVISRFKNKNFRLFQEKKVKILEFDKPNQEILK